uniref:Hox9 N-terminal activation domain-containing protein n=1 Tax=Sarcophilus harrisii TaxID=9305 RepID=A0A7N4PH52_SARHA
MSTSGTLSNYRGLFCPREGRWPAGPGALAQPARQPALGEHPDFSPCSFQSKASVFGTSWNPVHPPSAKRPFYPFYVPPGFRRAPDGRYIQPSCELATREIHSKKALSLHQAPNTRTGEGILVQYVSHQGPQIRSGKTPQPHRKTSQNLVSKQEDENEEN